MKTFKSFLQEARAEGSPKQVFEPLIDLHGFLSVHCKDSFWMIEKNKPLYRGFKNGLKYEPYYVDLTKTKRVSQNTSNWYTEIFDNHPEMRDFPKRSESLICSTAVGTAYQFGDAFVAIPIDDAKIGITNERDLWAKEVSLFGEQFGIDGANGFIDNIVRSGLELEYSTRADYGYLEQFSDEIYDNDSRAYKRLSKNSYYKDFLDNSLFTDAFLPVLLKAYSPDELKMDCATTKDFDSFSFESSTECWFDKGAVIIPLNKWYEMEEAIQKDKTIKKWTDFSRIKNG